MATVTNLLWLNPDSIPQAIATDDAVTAPGNWTFTQNVDILGNLTVTGSITSGSTLNSVSQDAFFDLGFGYLLPSNQAGGLTLDVKPATGFTVGNVTNFPTLTTFTYADAGGSTLLQAGDVIALVNMPAAFQTNEGYYVVQAVSGAVFPQTVTIYNTSQQGTPWANTAFTVTGAVAPPGNVTKVDMAVIAIANGTNSFTDSAGNNWPVGTVVSAYVPNATLAAFQAPGVYNVIGGTTLQQAYNNGNTIVTGSGNDIAFTLTNGDFSVDGTGSVLVGQTTPVEQFAVNAGTTGVDIEASGQIDVGAVALTAPVGTQTVQIPTVGSTNFIQPNGFLQSPNWPAPYPINSDGFVVFNSIAGVVRTITGTINTEANFDFVRVYDGSGIGGTLLYSVSGLAQPFSFTSGVNQTFTVRFNSDVSSVFAGFNLTVTGFTAQNINVGTGGGRSIIVGSTSAALVDLEAGNITSNAVTMSAEAAIIDIGTTTATGTYRFGTGLAAKTVSIGSIGTNSITTIEGGTGTGSIAIGNSNATSGSINIGNSTASRAIGIGTAAGNGPINIGVSTATGRSISIGNSLGTTSVSIFNGTGALNIAAGVSTGTLSIGTAGNRLINIGSISNTSALSIRGGTGGIVIETPGTIGAITIGNDTGTGTISIGSSTGARQINIGNGATSTGNVNIVGSGATGARTVDIGTGGTGTKIVRIGNDSVAGSTTSITAGTTGGVNIGNSAIATPVTIASNTTAGTVNVGTGTATQTLNFGSGAGIKTVTIGASIAGSATYLRGADGVIFGSPTAVMSPGGIRVFNNSVSTMAAGAVVIAQNGVSTPGGRPFVALANATTLNRQGFTGVNIASLASGAEGNAASVSGTIAHVIVSPAPASTADVGKPIYLSTVSGQSTLVAPSASGSRVYLIGYLTGTNTDANGNYPVQLYPQFVADIP